MNDLLSFLTKLQKLHPESLIAIKPSALYTTKYSFSFIVSMLLYDKKKNVMQNNIISIPL